MSSRSQALSRSFVEVRHVLRQYCVQFNQQSRSSFTIVSGPEMALENPARVAGQNRTGWERRYQRRQLLKLDDWLLGDIGYRLNMSDSKSGGAKPRA